MATEAEANVITAARALVSSPDNKPISPAATLAQTPDDFARVRQVVVERTHALTRLRRAVQHLDTLQPILQSKAI